MSTERRATRTLQHTLLCQNDKCHQRLGELHMPCLGGHVTLFCQKCKTLSEFESTPRGIQAYVIPPPVEVVGRR